MKASDRLSTAASFSGLSSRRQLINQATGRTTAHPASSVPMDRLAHNPFNPREELNHLEETVASLQEKGQLTALTVVTRDAFLEAHPDQEDTLADADWIVLDGNRRLTAARQAGLDELRIDVNDALAASATDLLENALLANLHRVDLAPMDEARVVRDLVKIHGSQGKVAKRLSKSGAWVSQRLALLELPDDLQEKVETGELKVKDGRRIGRLPEADQRAEAEKALNRVKAPRPPRAAHAPGSASSAPAPITPPVAPSPPGPKAPESPAAGTSTKEAESVNPVKTMPMVPEQTNPADPDPVAVAVARLLDLTGSVEALAEALIAHTPASTLTALSEQLIDQLG